MWGGPRGENVPGLGNSTCEGPGAGMPAWPECRERGRPRQPRGQDVWPEDELGSLPLYLFPFILFLYDTLFKTALWSGFI